jgi:hypothetical protein
VVVDKMKLAAVLGVVVLGAGVAVYALGFPGEDQPSCAEVEASLEAENTTIARTFGDGEEGRAAYARLVEVMESRPDCYSPDAVEMMRANRDRPDTPPQSDQPLAED